MGMLHDNSNTLTSSPNGLSGCQWQCLHKKQFCCSRCWTVWIDLLEKDFLLEKPHECWAINRLPVTISFCVVFYSCPWRAHTVGFHQVTSMSGGLHKVWESSMVALEPVVSHGSICVITALVKMLLCFYHQKQALLVIKMCYGFVLSLQLQIVL